MRFPGVASARFVARSMLLMHHVYVADFLLSTADLPYTAQNAGHQR